MANSSEFAVTSIFLSSYYKMQDLTAVHVCVFLFLYVVIIAGNMVLICVIYLEKSLHEPMYFLVCSQAANGLYGGTALLPSLLSNILSGFYEVSLACCLTQIFAIHTYAIVEFTILAAMSYDRYVAICYPLQYHSIMSLSRTYKLITLVWLYPLLAFLLVFVLTLQLRFCQNTIEKLYCHNHSLVKLSCTDTSLVNAVGLLSVALYSLPQLVMVLYSYVHILRICMQLPRQSRLKAFRTCMPGLASVANYSVGCFLEIVQSRLEGGHLPFRAKAFLSIYFLIMPPIINPVIYGMSFNAIRVPLLRLLWLLWRRGR